MFIELTETVPACPWGDEEPEKRKVLVNVEHIRKADDSGYVATLNGSNALFDEPYEHVRDTILSMDRDRERRQLAAVVLSKLDNLHVLTPKQQADAVRNALAIADMLMKGGADNG